MTEAERHKLMLDLLRDRPFASVRDLQAVVDASPATMPMRGPDVSLIDAPRLSAHQAARGRGQEVQHGLDVFVAALPAQGLDLGLGLLQRRAAAEDELVHLADELLAFVAEATALEAGEVHGTHRQRAAVDGHEGGDVLSDVTLEADHRMRADVHELDALCLEHIGRFKRPKRYEIVEALPKNNYGKVLKRELREKLKATRN